MWRYLAERPAGSPVTCAPNGERQEAELLFREVLAEQSMMTRARLKLGLLLVEDGRHDEGIAELQAVVSTWGDDAEQARGYLRQLGVEISSDDSNEEEENISLDAPPRLVSTTIAELHGFLPTAIVEAHGRHAAWFMTTDAGQRVQLFTRLPEAELSPEIAETIAAAIDAFAAQHGQRLAELLGSGGLQAGFHVGGSVEDVSASFEADGFTLVGRIVNGAVEEQP